MRAFVGQARGAKMIAMLVAAGIGECTQPSEYPPRRTPWFLDNEAYKAWSAAQTREEKRLGLARGTLPNPVQSDPFGEDRWVAVIARIVADHASGAVPLPEFGITPDIVAAGGASLDFSESWLWHCRTKLPGVAWYLAVQDGMTEDMVAASGSRCGFRGLFIGGSSPWKLRTGKGWVRLAHSLGIPCHVGRVGTPRKVFWARRIGADSVDSCYPLFSVEKNLHPFLAALGGAMPRQGHLW